MPFAVFGGSAELPAPRDARVDARPRWQGEKAMPDSSDLTVTSMRDTVALPEDGGSWGGCPCQGSSSCAAAEPAPGSIEL